MARHIRWMPVLFEPGENAIFYFLLRKLRLRSQLWRVVGGGILVNMTATFSKLSLNFGIKYVYCIRKFHIAAGCIEIENTICIMHLVVIDYLELEQLLITFPLVLVSVAVSVSVLHLVYFLASENVFQRSHSIVLINPRPRSSFLH